MTEKECNKIGNETLQSRQYHPDRNGSTKNYTIRKSRMWPQHNETNVQQQQQKAKLMLRKTCRTARASCYIALTLDLIASAQPTQILYLDIIYQS